MSLAQIIPYVQIILSVLLVIGILLQQTDAGAGGAFGGGDGFSSVSHTKRGAEKLIFNSTIIVALLLVISSFSLLFI